MGSEMCIRDSYSMLSAPGLAVNIKTEDARFLLRGGRLTVDGSFITEAHMSARLGDGGKRAVASFWASELNEENWGWGIINGSCFLRADIPRPFVLGKHGSRECLGFSIDVSMSSAYFSLRNWTVIVRGNHVYDWISGPKHRLDVSFSARGDAAARDLPHGLIGQSFASTAPRFGMVDEYPEAGHFTTSAMGEGAIEGEAMQYEVASPYATDFAFSRFLASEEAALRSDLRAMLDASTSERVASYTPRKHCLLYTSPSPRDS